MQANQFNFIGNFQSVASNVSEMTKAEVQNIVEVIYIHTNKHNTFGGVYTGFYKEETSTVTFFQPEDQNMPYDEFLEGANEEWHEGDYDAFVHVALLENMEDKVVGIWVVGKGYTYRGTAKLADDLQPLHWEELEYDAKEPIQNMPKRQPNDFFEAMKSLARATFVLLPDEAKLEIIREIEEEHDGNLPEEWRDFFGQHGPKQLLAA